MRFGEGSLVACWTHTCPQHRCVTAALGCQGSVMKHEWVGMGDDGFPVPEGKASNVVGEFFEIW